MNIQSIGSVKPIGLHMARSIEPFVLRRDVVRGVEAQSAHHMARYLDTLLRRIGIESLPTVGREDVIVAV